MAPSGQIWHQIEYSFLLLIESQEQDYDPFSNFGDDCFQEDDEEYLENDIEKKSFKVHILISKISTLEFLISVALRLLILRNFSRGYALICRGLAYYLLVLTKGFFQEGLL